MKKVRLLLLVLVLIVAGAGSASARWVAVTAKMGTTGYGGDLTLRLARWMNVRAGYNYYDVGLDIALDEAEIDGEIVFTTIPVLLDLHPFGGGFRFTGGVVINNSEVNLSALPNEVVELEGTDYEVDSLDGSITFDNLAYYIGIGVGNAVSDDGRWHFSADFGLMYQGNLEAEAEASATDPTLQDLLNADLNAELDQLEEDAGSFIMYPVLTFGLSFAF